MTIISVFCLQNNLQPPTLVLYLIHNNFLMIISTTKTRLQICLILQQNEISLTVWGIISRHNTNSPWFNERSWISRMNDTRIITRIIAVILLELEALPVIPPFFFANTPSTLIWIELPIFFPTLIWEVRVKFLTYFPWQKFPFLYIYKTLPIKACLATLC